MLTLKTIMSQIWVGDWFVTVDLKDAYFHIQVVRQHRKFLRFTFGGKAYQYKSSSLWPGFGAEGVHKMHGYCPGPVEAPGHSCTQLPGRLAHSGPLQGVSELSQGCRPPHVRALGLRTNTKKSVLSPSQQTVFLGVHLDSVQMQGRLAPARISSLNTCLPDLGFVRQSGSEPLCITWVVPMPALVLPEFAGTSGHRCACSSLAGHAFPPVKLILAVLSRVKESGVRLLLVAPFWPSQTWFL